MYHYSFLENDMSHVFYAHTLVFACPDCNQPIAVSHLTEERNLESVDGQMLYILCSHCNSSAEVLGATAKRHLVQRWERPRAIAAVWENHRLHDFVPRSSSLS